MSVNIIQVDKTLLPRLAITKKCNLGCNFLSNFVLLLYLLLFLYGWGGGFFATFLNYGGKEFAALDQAVDQ